MQRSSENAEKGNNSWAMSHQSLNYDRRISSNSKDDKLGWNNERSDAKEEQQLENVKRNVRHSWCNGAEWNDKQLGWSQNIWSNSQQTWGNREGSNDKQLGWSQNRWSNSQELWGSRAQGYPHKESFFKEFHSGNTGSTAVSDDLKEDIWRESPSNLQYYDQYYGVGRAITKKSNNF